VVFGLGIWATAAEPGSPAAASGKDAFSDPLPAGAKFRLGTDRFHHRGNTYSPGQLVLSPDGQKYAVSSKGFVAVHSSATGQAIWKAEETEQALSKGMYTGKHLAFSTDGASLVTARSSQLALWDARTGKKLSTVAFPAPEPLCLAISADLKLAACAVADKEGVPTVSLWKPSDGKVLGNLTPVHNVIHSLELSPDGRVLAVCGSYLAKNDSNQEMQKAEELAGTIQLWDAKTLKELQRIKVRIPEEDTQEVLGMQQAQRSPVVRLSSDGAVLYTATKEGVESWDTKTGKRLHRFAVRTKARKFLWLSADGKRLATGGEDGEIDVCYITTGERLSAGKRPDAKKWQLAFAGFCGFGGNFEVKQAPFDVVFPADGSSPLVGTIDVNRVRIESLSGGKANSLATGHRAEVMSVAVSKDGKQIVSIGGGQVIRWDAETGKAIGPVTELPNELVVSMVQAGLESRVIVSPDGRLYARISPGEDGDTVQVFDLATGTEVITIPAPDPGDGTSSVSFSNNGKRLLWSATTGSEEKGLTETVLVWDTETGRVVFERTVSPDKNEAFDGSHAILTQDGTELAWGLNRSKKVNGKEEQSVTEWTGWDLETGKRLGRMEFSETTNLESIPCGDRSIITNNPDGKLVKWDLVSGKVTSTFDAPENVRQMVASPDGKTLAFHVLAEGKAKSGSIILLDTPTGKRIRQLADPAISGSEFELMPLAISPDGKLLVTGHSNSTVLVWDVDALPPAK
jgi:WD40 repeat protein